VVSEVQDHGDLGPQAPGEPEGRVAHQLEAGVAEAGQLEAGVGVTEACQLEAGVTEAGQLEAGVTGDGPRYSKNCYTGVLGWPNQLTEVRDQTIIVYSHTHTHTHTHTEQLAHKHSS